MTSQSSSHVRVTLFFLLQLTGLVLSVLLEPVLGGYVLLLDVLLFLAGVVMGVLGLARCLNNGQGPLQLLGASGLVFLGSLIFWPVFAMVVWSLLTSLPGFGRDPSRDSIFLCGPLYFFSTGSLAYFGFWPFNSQVSPSQTVRQLIVGNRDLRVGCPAAPEVVAKAERLLGLLLPTCFREFLLDYGQIRGTAVTFLGLGPATDLDRPSNDDFVGATLDARERLDLPKGYVVCSASTHGVMACLDTAALQTEIPVVLWNSDTRSVVGVAAPSFDQYLIQTLRSKARSR